MTPRRVFRSKNDVKDHLTWCHRPVRSVTTTDTRNRHRPLALPSHFACLRPVRTVAVTGDRLPFAAFACLSFITPANAHPHGSTHARELDERPRQGPGDKEASLRRGSRERVGRAHNTRPNNKEASEIPGETQAHSRCRRQV